MSPTAICITASLLVATAVLLWTAHTHPRVRRYLRLPLPIRRASAEQEAAVDAVLAQAATAEPRAIGTPGPRPVYAWCVPCREFLTFCCAGHALGHARDHAHDLALWERELSDRTAR